MKYTLIFISLIFCATITAQESIKYNRAHVIYPGCEEAEDQTMCYDSKVLGFLSSSLTEDLSQKMIRLSKKDTIKIFSRLYFDEQGKVLTRESSFSASVDSTYKDLKYLVDLFPTVAPVLDSKNNGVAEYVSTISGFQINRDTNTLTTIEGYQPEEVPFSVIEKVPLYDGCSRRLSNKASKECMNKKIARHVSKNFNSDLAGSLNLTAGIKRIYVFFKVDKEGKISSVRARAPHPMLEREAIRVIKSLPDAKKPGMQRGKPVIVPYSLPITFNIEDIPLTKKQLRAQKRKNKKG